MIESNKNNSSEEQQPIKPSRLRRIIGKKDLTSKKNKRAANYIIKGDPGLQYNKAGINAILNHTWAKYAASAEGLEREAEIYNNRPWYSVFSKILAILLVRLHELPKTKKNSKKVKELLETVLDLSDKLQELKERAIKVKEHPANQYFLSSPGVKKEISKLNDDIAKMNQDLLKAIDAFDKLANTQTVFQYQDGTEEANKIQEKQSKLQQGNFKENFVIINEKLLGFASTKQASKTIKEKMQQGLYPEASKLLTQEAVVMGKSLQPVIMRLFALSVSHKARVKIVEGMKTFKRNTEETMENISKAIYHNNSHVIKNGGGITDEEEIDQDPAHQDPAHQVHQDPAHQDLAHQVHQDPARQDPDHQDHGTIHSAHSSADLHNGGPGKNTGRNSTL